MTYKLLRYTMTLLMALTMSGMLVSCIFDDYVDADFSEPEGQALYLSINVKSDSDIALTREGNAEKVPDANGMLDGEWPEHLATDHIALFFNDNEAKDGPGSLYAMTTLGLPAMHEDIEDNPNKKEANYIAIFRVTKEDKERIESGALELPKYCLVILNGGRIKKLLEDKYKNKDVDYNTIVKEIWESNDEPEKIGFNDAGRFTMTNSVYVEKEKENEKVKVHAAQKFSLDKFFDTPDEAKKHPTVTIYVERMVAKFTLEFEIGDDSNSATRSATDKSNGIIIDPKNSEGKDAAPLVFFDQFNKDEKLYKKWPWKVMITGWGINAQEQNSYLFKNIDPTKEEGYFKKWNDSDNYRSYWCEDPHYDYGEDGKAWTYPLQNREAFDYKTSKELEYYGKKNQNYLKNYSYKQFVDNTKNEVYAPENTYDPSLYNMKDQEAYLDDRTNLLAGTHLLVCAEVLIDKGDGEGYVPPKHLYRDRQGIYYESKEQFFRMFVHSINSLFESQRTMDFTLYNWDEGGLIKKPVKTDDGTEEEVYEFTAKPVNQNETDNTNKVIYQLYYYDPNDTRLKELRLTDDMGYMKLTDDNIDMLIDNGLFDDMIEMIPATIEYGDGRVLPWLTSNKLVICANDKQHSGLDIYTRDKIEPFYKKDDKGDLILDDNGDPIQIGYEIIYGEKVELEEDEYDNCIKSLLCEWFGPIDHFNGGKMYYAHPISHIKPESESKAIAETEALGAYGVVRNCWYQFTLKGINMIGTPVDDPDDPIVPQEINIKDVINTKVAFEFIPWHEENTTAPLY